MASLVQVDLKSNNPARWTKRSRLDFHEERNYYMAISDPNYSEEYSGTYSKRTDPKSQREHLRHHALEEEKERKLRKFVGITGKDDLTRIFVQQKRMPCNSG